MSDALSVVDVLLVEDDPGDALMTQEAFEEHKVRNRLTVVSDGAEALSYLRREGQYTDAVRPDLILLDVMMPGMDGPAVLAVLRAEAGTAAIPVAFITARTGREDVERLLSLGACGVIAKPFDPMTLAERARALL